MSNQAKFLNGTRWETRTAYSLSKSYPSGISMDSELLRCPCCHQLLSLVCAYNKVPYFRHPSAEEDKSCALRAQSYSLYGFYAGEREFPLKIEIENKKVQFLMGFFKVSDELLKKGFNFSLEVETENQDWEIKKFSSDRLFYSTTTYLGIGRRPPVSVIVNSPEETEWPESRNGVKQTGSLFDAHSGKLLPNDADVEVGKEYFLLLRSGELRKNRYRFAVSIDEKEVDLNGWDLIVCKADQPTVGAANFFFEYSANLTDRPVSITPVWPLTTRSSYEISSGSKVIYIAFTGDVRSKIHPDGCFLELDSNKNINNPLNSVFEVKTVFRPVISLGRSSLIKFVQVVYKPQEETPRLFIANLSFRDIDGNEITEDVLHESLRKDILICTSTINLKYEIYKDRALIAIGDIQSNVENKIDLLRGQTIKVFNGKDLQKELCIKGLKKAKEKTNSDNDFTDQRIYSMAPLNQVSPLTAMAYRKKFPNEIKKFWKLKGISTVQVYKLIK